MTWDKVKRKEWTKGLQRAAVARDQLKRSISEKERPRQKPVTAGKRTKRPQ